SAAENVSGSAVPRAPEKEGKKAAPSPARAARGLAAPAAHRQDAPGAQTIRIGVGVLDDLLELIGEVVLGRNQFLHTYENDATFKNLSQSITKLHQHVIRTRMQPIGAIFEKFQRTVRDLSQKLGKKVDLHIEGGEIELDRTILEALSDPLTHLIRNAVDHGIDTLEERSAMGKATVGSIHLRAYHESGQILIEVEDDGRGIDPDAVREKALEKGLVTPDEAKRLSGKDLIQFVFHPGFSTKSVATEVSGRGVGMDVVKTNLERLGCLVEISSRKGRGTLVSARIPLTQAIVNSSVISCLIIHIGSYTLTIPEVAVNEIIRLSPEDQADRIETVKGQEVFKLRDKVIPLVHLEDILDIPRTYYHPVKKEFLPDRRRTIAPPKDGDRAATGASGPQNSPPGWKKRRSSLIFIVLQYKQDFFGVLVDQIVGTEEIVVKRLPSIIRNRKIFGGVTILGNGTVSLILDIKGMVEKAGLHFVKAQDAGRHFVIRRKKSVDDWQEMVLFTNHDEEYFAIPVNLLSEIDRFNVKDVKQVGSKEFIQLHGMSMPLLRLESHLDVKPVSKSRELLTVLVPARVKYPSGIVANRILGTLELRQTINTQDANDKGIIGTFFDNDRMITVIDIFALMHGSDPQKYKDLVEEDIQYCRVLLAEDQLFFRQLISQYFRSFGIRSITVANDGREALDVLHATPQGFDVVVSDIEMPNMNGYQLVSNVKSDPLLRHLPVMALTSLAGDEDIRRGMEAGFDAYEVKIDKERVIRRLNEIYRKSRGKGQNGR
ncbi:MAG: chemotaxis protein CheW, partial [Syntrophobacteraceae bacterium]